ncbi:hypothetical protein JXA32_00250 [Candidatus Sumerlaeota bacterium]|nr:hypothetical protein [Candidatus Sumerlaeota bacterium]
MPNAINSVNHNGHESPKIKKALALLVLTALCAALLFIGYDLIKWNRMIHFQNVIENSILGMDLDSAEKYLEERLDEFRIEELLVRNEKQVHTLIGLRDYSIIGIIYSLFSDYNSWYVTGLLVVDCDENNRVIGLFPIH